MAKRVLILVGTKKGAFIIEGDAARRSWKLRGPFCETWPMNHVIADPVTGTIYGSEDPAVALPALLEDVRAGRLELRSLLGPSYPLAQADEAFRASLAGSPGRVIVTP